MPPFGIARQLRPGMTRVTTSEAVLGAQAIEVDAQAPVTPPWLVPLFQPVPRAQVQALTDRTLTLGAWMWASQPVKARTPQLSDGSKTVFQTVELSQAPVFHAITMKLTKGSDRLWVSLTPKVSPDAGPLKVYYDGIVLAQGLRPLQTPPTFSGSQGRSWGMGRRTLCQPGPQRFWRAGGYPGSLADRRSGDPFSAG